MYLCESRPEKQSYWRSLGLIDAARMSIDHEIQVFTMNKMKDEDDDAEPD